MITLVVDSEKILKETIIVDNLADINHIKNVFRKNIGETIRAVDGKFEYICEIKEIENRTLKLKILSSREENSSEIEIEAGISLLKNEKMDLTIQKLTEIGIKNIIPVAAKRSIVKLEKKKDKWDTIVRETLKQCQGISPTKISEIRKISEISYADYDLIIVPYEAEEEFYLKQLLKKIEKEKKIKKILYIIGPEGGFEKEEIEFLKDKGAYIISLGKRILRAETAAIVTGGVLVNEFQ